MTHWQIARFFLEGAIITAFAIAGYIVGGLQ